MIKPLVQACLDLLLKPEVFRRRLAFEISHRHHEDLNIAVPLGHGLDCPVYSKDAWLSFKQIFCDDEYAAAWEVMPIPEKWLDLGCHAGYFSLYVYWLRARQNLPKDGRSLLVDADSRVRPAIERLAKLNHLEGRLHFRHGVISASTEPLRFTEREFMNSSAFDGGPGGGTVREVHPITQAEIISVLPGPYDLVKLDIEGGEYDFLNMYRRVLAQTKHLIMEWHSWQPGGGGRTQLETLLAGLGFQPVRELLPSTQAGAQGTVGVVAYSRVSPAA